MTSDIQRAYRALFLTADGSKLKPEAEVVLRDLEKRTGWMNTQAPIDNSGRVDPYRAVGYHEKRGVYSHIKKQIFSVPKE